MVRKILIWIFLGLMILLLIAGFAMKNSMNNYISKMMRLQSSPDIARSGEILVESLYNYSKNAQNFEITLLEFGSNSCVPCKQMEPVLEEIRNSGKVKVNVVFLNTMKPENLTLMKYFGISAIPMQIMLDKQGKEFYRHYGFISANDLMTKTFEINSTQL